MGDVGLYAKYIITKADGTPVNDRCFVLKPDKDPAAAKALQAYAAATDDEQLRNNLYAWVGKPTLKPMTLEELEKRIAEFDIRDEDTYYVERKDSWSSWLAAMYIWYDMFLHKDAKEQYGKKWRCWERKPTDEERSDAEWITD